MRKLFAAAMPALLIATTAAADIGGDYQGSGFGAYMHDGGMHGYWVMPLMMIAFVIVTVVAIVLILRWIGTDRHSSGATERRGSAADILRERFAQGDIDEAEYRERTKVLAENG